MKKAFLILIVLFISLQNMTGAFGQEVKQLSSEIRSTKDNVNKKNLIHKLAGMRPKSQNDVEDLVSIAETAKDSDEKKASLGALQNVNEENRQQLASAYTKALDSKDKDTRVNTMFGIGKMKAKEAAPKIREIVKGFGKGQAMEYKAMKMINRVKALEIIREPVVAAITLGELKDEEAIQIIVDKYEETDGYVAEGLSKIGKKAIPALLELAKKETDPRRKDSPAQKALASVKDIEAKPDLINILKTENNRDIRMRVLTALNGDMYDDEVLETVKTLYEKEKDSMFLSAMRSKDAIPFLINVLKNDKDSHSRACAASALEDIGDPSTVPALEEALKDWNSYVKDAASRALEKITGKKYEWRKK